MPRSRGGAGPSRSAPRPQAPAPPPRSVAPQQQQRPMSTTATKPGQQQAQTGQSPGLFGQMASTAAGVAVGSSIGHAIGGWFGGGSSSSSYPEAEAQQQQYQQPVDAYGQTGQQQGLYNATAQQQAEVSGPCATDIRNFTDCMNQNQGNLTICGWYMEQLKACQAASRQY